MWIQVNRPHLMIFINDLMKFSTYLALFTETDRQSVKFKR